MRIRVSRNRAHSLGGSSADAHYKFVILVQSIRRLQTGKVAGIRSTEPDQENDMSRLHLMLSALTLSIVASDSWASGQVAMRQDVTLALANQLLDAALSACHAEGLSAVAAVVDRGGNLVALQRDDNVGPHNALAAQRKAFTALSTKTPTRLLAQRARGNPDAENLNAVDELLLLGGGVPLKAGDQVIGAIGVAGAGGAANDEGCALKAIEQIPSIHS